MDLPVFEFKNGYIFECIDLGDAGLKLDLNYTGHESRAIILPPEQCELFLNWQNKRIGKRVSVIKEKETSVSEEFISLIFGRNIDRTKAIIAEALLDVGVFHGIIENDIGITYEQIVDYPHKKRVVVYARDLLNFIFRMRTELSMPIIARILGATSHASVFVSLRKFDTNGINKKLYKGSDLLKIYNDAKKRYKKAMTEYE